MKTIKFNLSKNSIENAINELNAYKNSLDEKVKRFVSLLSARGYEVTSTIVDGISVFYKGDDISVDIVETNQNGVAKAVITISGEQCAFIEFGAGVVHNVPKGKSKHPKGEEKGLTIGSYNPSSKNAEKPGGWFYKDKYGHAVHTLGTPTYAPLYSGFLEMKSEALEIGRIVFGSK